MTITKIGIKLFKGNYIEFYNGKKLIYYSLKKGCDRFILNSENKKIARCSSFIRLRNLKKIHNIELFDINLEIQFERTNLLFSPHYSIIVSRETVDTYLIVIHRFNNYSIFKNNRKIGAIYGNMNLRYVNNYDLHLIETSNLNLIITVVSSILSVVIDSESGFGLHTGEVIIKEYCAFNKLN